MKVLSLLAVLIFAAASVAHGYRDSYAARFADWMHAHGKTYASHEFHHRFQVWKQNMQFVENFKGTHTVSMNIFGDLSSEEFKNVYNGLKVSARNPADLVTFASSDALPASVDWRTKGVVTPVKNQGQCGSCWSFSTTGSTEGAHALKTKSLVSLSEQNLMDCSTSFGNQGCNGGLMDDAFKYIIANKGIDKEACYPYTAQDGNCNYSTSCIGATLTSYKDVTSGSESDLQTAVATIGPVSVAINAGLSSFQFYSGGVYSDPSCSGGENDLDHGVLVVGYGTLSSTAMWIVKNSWGASWGVNGYIMMARNDNNMCGIATAASYPIA